MNASSSPAEYEPLEWPAGCELSSEERAEVETQRRKLWRDGVRDPKATLLACQRAAVVCFQRAARRAGVQS